MVEASAEGQPTVIELKDYVNYLGSASINKADAQNNPLMGVVFDVVNQ